jgi:L-threonylcarbamoyladenylate synthase
VALLPVNEANLARAAEVLRAGGTVAFPTETVYGLGAIAFDPAAVARIFEIKRRPSFDPLIVHVAGRAMLEEVVSGVPPVAKALIEAFWPGPLTLVLAKSLAIGDLVTAGSSKVAVRMPSHWVARALLERVGAPLAAPSANPFGALSPTRAEHVAARLGDRVDLILDGGPAEHGIESTIVALEPWPMLLRPGAIPVEEIEAIAGALDRAPEAAAIVPGRLPQHYSPATPLRLIDPALVAPSDRRGAASLALRDTFGGYDISRALSNDGDLRVAAARFFETLHELDATGVARIDAQPFPESGLGLAIMDRLRRAAARNG